MKPGFFESQVKKGEPVKHAQKTAQRIRDNFGIPDFNIHSLRTTAATRIAGLGVPPQVLSKILNHKKPGEGSTITASTIMKLRKNRTGLKKLAESCSVVLLIFSTHLNE